MSEVVKTSMALTFVMVDLCPFGPSFYSVGVLCVSFHDAVDC